MTWRPVPDHERSHFNKDGKSKRAYPSQEAAEAAALELKPHAYQCPICGKWHIGRGDAPGPGPARAVARRHA